MPEGVLIPELVVRNNETSKPDPLSSFRIGLQVVADAMESFVGYSAPFFATSPEGVCLRLSNECAASMLGVGATEDLMKELVFRAGEPTFIFIEPTLFFLSTAKWENVDFLKWKRNVDEGFLLELQLLALQLGKFEGWGVSIRESDLPNKLSDLTECLPPYGLDLEQESVCTPNAILTKFASSPGITKNEIRHLFPGVSVRRFNYAWARAAEADPSLSKPGRKPTAD